MKNLLTLISLFFISLSVTANTTKPTTGGEESKVVCENADVQFSILTSSDSGLIVSAAANTVLTTIGEEESEIVFENIDVQFSVLSSSDSDLIESTTYNQANDFFNITTEQSINFLQVLNAEGVLEYQLPIGSNKLNLAMPDFSKGTYKINLLMEGGDVFVSTELVKKF